MQLTKTKEIDLELIADRAMIFCLKKYGNKFEFEYQEKINRLLKRRIAGENLTVDEIRAITNSSMYTYDDYYYDYDYDTVDYVIDFLDEYIEPIDQLDKKVLDVINRWEVMYVRSEGIRDPIDKLDNKVLEQINMRKFFLDLYKLVINFHPKGTELEKHFGKWMAATIIHYTSTGEYVDYYASKADVM